jgi:hypothetical protein
MWDRDVRQVPGTRQEDRAVREDSGIDQFTIDRIRALVEELRVQKAALHP